MQNRSSENEVWCKYDTKLQRHGYCISTFNGNLMLIVKYIHGRKNGKGYLLNDQTILEEQEYIDDELLNVTTYQAEWDIIDQPSGSRFEGRVINKEPYGYGSYYDDNGILRYCGTMVGWNRLGYGVRYYDTSHVEYDGMWVMNQFQGRGKKVAQNGEVSYDGNYIEDTPIFQYVGDGSGLCSSITDMTLVQQCILSELDFSLFKSVEKIHILDGICFQSKEFIIENLSELQKLEVRHSCFEVNKPFLEVRITNCPSLESIEIGNRSFRFYNLRITSK